MLDVPSYLAISSIRCLSGLLVVLAVIVVSPLSMKTPFAIQSKFLIAGEALALVKFPVPRSRRSCSEIDRLVLRLTGTLQAGNRRRQDVRSTAELGVNGGLLQLGQEDRPRSSRGV